MAKSDQVTSTDNHDASGLPTCQAGQKLVQIRIANNISVADMAARLKLPEKRIVAIESGQFTDKKLDIFDRGHIRNYCRVLREDIEEAQNLSQEIFDLLKQDNYDLQLDDYVVHEKKISHKTLQTPKVGMMVTRTKILAVLVIVLGLVMAGIIGHRVGSHDSGNDSTPFDVSNSDHEQENHSSNDSRSATTDQKHLLVEPKNGDNVFTVESN